MAINAVCITVWAVLGVVLAPLAAGADDGLPAAVRSEAWFTGSLDSAAASTLPEGHFLVQPYLTDAIALPDGGRASQTVHSLNLLLYGVSDELMVGLIPRFSWGDRPAVGDVTARLQYRFARYDPASAMPALALVFNETLPTGKYDDLDRDGGDGSGSGAFASQWGLLADDYFSVADRTLRLRLNLLYGVSTRVDIRNRSVYGTSEGFRGHASPGATYDAILALEYSLDTRWAAALDITWDRGGKTYVDGLDFQSAAPAGQSASLAPALEYNLTAYTGVIAGVQMPVWRENSSRVVVPMVALNCVF